MTKQRPRRSAPRLALMGDVLSVRPRDREKPPRDLLDVLDRVKRHIERDPTPESLTFGEVADAVGRRSFGPLLLIIGLFAISPLTAIPGLTWLSALLTFLVAVQMAVGMRRTWLPKPLLDVKLPRDPLARFIASVRPRAEKLERGGWLTTRLAFLSAPPFVNVVALLVMAAALITIPLGLIPFAPLAPGLAVVFFGLGMTARDGLWLLVGTALFVGALWFTGPLIF